MPEQMNKARLLDEIRTKYTALEQLLTPLDQEQMTTAGVTGEWSIKDILAHITAWHHRLLDRLDAAMQHKQPTYSTLGMTDADIDRLNEQFYQESKQRSLDEVLADFHTTYQQIVAALQSIAEEDLTNPQRFAWTGGNLLWDYVAGDTYEHYEEHMEPIQAWLAKAR